MVNIIDYFICELIIVHTANTGEFIFSFKLSLINLSLLQYWIIKIALLTLFFVTLFRSFNDKMDSEEGKDKNKLNNYDGEIYVRQKYLYL